jgi:hypothetical protein
MDLHQLNKSQLITLIDNYDNDREWRGGFDPNVKEFLESEVNEKKPYLAVRPVEFINNKLKDEIIPDYIIADGIIDVFEDILDKNNISIPDKFREGNEDEANIYGSTYEEMYERVDNLIKIHRNSIENEITNTLDQVREEVISNLREDLNQRFN